MEDVKIQYCKLCLTIINGDNFEEINNVTKDMLGILLLKLDFDDEYKHVMCNICSVKLFAAYAFKLACFHTDNIINSYANGTTLSLDLREIYLRESNSKDILDDTIICRLCMHPIKNVLEFNLINEEQVDMILKLVPEMNVFTIKEPVMCKLCQDSLVGHCDFLKKCSGVEQKIGCISSGRVPEALPSVQSVDVPVKIENLDMKFEEEPQLIKMEVVDTNINCDETENESVIHRREIPVEVTTSKGFTTNYEKIALENAQAHQEDFSGMKIEKCPEVNILECAKHTLIPKDPSEVQKHKCATCNYETKDEGRLKRHMLLRNHPSKVYMHKCEKCSFETEYWKSLKKHILTHKYSSAVQIYKCEKCNFETEYKPSDKGPSEVQIYKCEHCNYESDCKEYVKYKLIHKDPLVQMYKCATCDYETVYKRSIERHKLKHKDPSQVQMYKCELCDHKTRYKGCLTQHMKRVHDPLKVRKYKSRNRDYQTKCRSNFKNNVVIEKDPPNVQLYKCEKCNYETKYAPTQDLMSADKDSLAAQIFKCEHCNAEFICKEYVKYDLIHKDPSEVEMYKCERCDYKTKFKGSLKRHRILKHKDPLKS